MDGVDAGYGAEFLRFERGGGCGVYPAARSGGVDGLDGDHVAVGVVGAGYGVGRSGAVGGGAGPAVLAVGGVHDVVSVGAVGAVPACEDFAVAAGNQHAADGGGRRRLRRWDWGCRRRGRWSWILPLGGGRTAVGSHAVVVLGDDDAGGPVVVARVCTGGGVVDRFRSVGRVGCRCRR